MILYTLTKYDCTIYRIAKIIETTFYPFLKPSLGAINPALKRLKKDECITFEEKMTNGGMKTKIVSLTSFGLKTLKTELLTFEYKNPTNFLINVSIALFCSNILKGDELIEFKKNLLNQIIIYKNFAKNHFESPYNSETPLQKQIVENAVQYISKLEALCQTE